MEYFVKSGNPEKQRVACVIVGIFDRRTLSEAADIIDKPVGDESVLFHRRSETGAWFAAALHRTGTTATVETTIE